MTSPGIQSRRIGPADIHQLQAIARRTFFEAFASENSAENMSGYLDDACSLERLAKELDTEDSQFHFAELEGRVIGYLKGNTGAAQTEPMGDDAPEIEWIYVLK
jgi:diamine N-acetyltransferase